MKKKIIISIIVFVLLVGVCYYIRLPDYEVFNSYSHSNSYHGTRDTNLKVVVYRYRAYNDLFDEIEREHTDVNGTPTTLTIDLYYSKSHLHNGTPSKTKNYEY